MRNKKGNMAVIAAIIAIVAITAGVVSWQFAKKSETPIRQTMPAPVAQTPAQSSASQPVASTQTRDETANWQTYTNSKYGFELKLPSSLNGYIASIRSYDTAGDRISFSLPITDKEYLKYAEKGTDGKSYWETFAVVANDITGWNKNVNSAICKNNKNPGPDCFNEVYKIGQNNKYVFTYSFPQDMPNEIRLVVTDIEKNMDAIKKRFKQTSAQSTDETANWQIYKNTELGFEVKVPPEYVAKLGNKDIEEPIFYIVNPKKDESSGLDHPFAFSFILWPNLAGGTGESGVVKNPDEWFAIQEKNTYVKTSVNGKVAYVKDSISPVLKVKEREYDVFIDKKNTYFDMYQFFIRTDDLGKKFFPLSNSQSKLPKTLYYSGKKKIFIIKKQEYFKTNFFSN